MDELAEAAQFADDNKLAIFVLGGGSNVLVSDEGFDGLVIRMNIRGLWINDFASRLSTGVVLRVGAGEMWDDVVVKTVELGGGGIENLSLIPGTVGGAVYQNIGAYGTELKDVLTSVRVYDVKNDKIIELSNKECGLEYRSSIFKKNKDLIVLEAELWLSKESKPNLSYPDLQKRFNGLKPTINEIRQAVIEIRLDKIPYPLNIMPHFLENKGHLLIANAGSFFKNPTIEISKFESLTSKYPDIKGRQTSEGLVKLSAAQLIEKCGFKGKKVGNVGISEKHALVLVNYGNGTSKELIDLAETVKEAVEPKFGVKLKAEVEKI